jgi:hypothetical protein
VEWIRSTETGVEAFHSQKFLWAVPGSIEFVSLLCALSSSLNPYRQIISSIGWEDLGNGFQIGRVSLNEFHGYFRQCPACLHGIQVTKVLLVDHLGNKIPVPVMFCSSWKVNMFHLPQMFKVTHVVGIGVRLRYPGLLLRSTWKSPGEAGQLSNDMR